MYEPMQPEIVSQMERAHEVELDQCDRCGDEIDMRLLEAHATGQRLNGHTVILWLCPDCLGKSEAEIENYWSDIGEDMRDGRI